MRKRSTGYTEITFVAISLVLMSGAAMYLNLFVPASFEYTWKEVNIPEGSAYSRGISILEEEGIVKNGFILRLLGKVTGTEKKLRTGYYNLSASMTPLEVFNRLKKGMIIQYLVTIPEGSTLADIKYRLRSRGLIDEDSWQVVNNKDFAASLNIDAPSIEGYLYPDTYNFAKGTETRNIISMMVYRLRQNFDHSMRKRAGELGMSENDTLTLASIIEKEALYDRERPIISAVYHNRLRKKIRLQADPTVVYGIKRPGEGITLSDLRRNTPYNTYVIDGLPPGPIASPGKKSIIAALYPADVDYLYFVSKNDGTHYFSRTGEEHMQAVMLYQRNSGKENAKKDEGQETD